VFELSSDQTVKPALAGKLNLQPLSTAEPLVEIEQTAEIQINFRQTVPAGQAVRITQSYWAEGVITQVMMDFPPGCNGLVDMALFKDEQAFYPVSGFLALNAATPVYYAQASYYAKEPLTVIIQNRDAANPHTPTCTVVIRFKKPAWY
jgi:hypothetical protein